MKKKNLIFWKRHLFIPIIILSSIQLTGCAKVSLLQDTFIIEAGESMSSDPADYAEFSKENTKASASLQIGEVDTNTVGTYPASITLKDKEYPFTVEVVDTTAPAVKLKETQILVRSTEDVKPEYFIDTVEDMSECMYGFRNPLLEMTADQVCAEFTMSQELLEGKEGEDLEEAVASLDEGKEELKAYSEILNPEELTQNLILGEDGQYLVELVVADASGNATVSEIVVFLDSTPPVVEGAEPITIAYDDLTDEALLVNVTATDNMFGDLTGAIEYVEVQKDESTESGLKDIFRVLDYAGNETIFERSITVTNIPTYGSISANSLSEGTSDKNEIPQDGFDRAKAEEAFALVNEQRIANGLPALGWNENLYDLACVRAQEIVEKFAHERLDGTSILDTLRSTGYASGGENISKNGNTASKTVEGWMNSEGHRENIMMTYYSQGCMACYCSNGKYYWVNLFNG